MWKALSIVGIVVATSCYIFPFEFKALPGFNTKMGLAAIGLVLFLFQLAENRDSLLNKQTFQLSTIAILISLIGLFAITYNDTSDMAYVTYIVSLWVWLGGAYTVAFLIKKLHKNNSVILVGNYLIAVCVMQCVLAIMIDRIPIVFNIVDTYIGNFGVGGSVEGFEESGRLYGIGAAVDFAGARFAPVLLIVAFLMTTINDTNLRKYLPIYILAFLIITFIGNMMARTTTLGTLMAICFWIYMTCNRSVRNMGRLWGYLLGILAIAIPLIIVLYYTNSFIYEKVRFGFEGFFSLIENGHWETNSNNILRNMYRFPETFKTWIIGDGYFDNPRSDPYYVGYMWKGFYMGTDVGYLRLIFYFGLVGLFAMIWFMAQAAMINAKRFPQYRMLFLLLLLTNLVIWFKVSTDLLPILALFLMINPEDEDIYRKRIASEK